MELERKTVAEEYIQCDALIKFQNKRYITKDIHIWQMVEKNKDCRGKVWDGSYTGGVGEGGRWDPEGAHNCQRYILFLKLDGDSPSFILLCFVSSYISIS